MLIRKAVAAAYTSLKRREPRASQPEAAQPLPERVKTLTRDDVVAIYRQMLRRAPESEAALELHFAAHDSPEALRASLMQSEEYRRLQNFSAGRKIQLADLDAEVALLSRLHTEDLPEFHRLMSDFWLEIPACSAAPSSAEYLAWVMQTYAAIANRSYEHASEVTAFDIDANAKMPFPYSTGSAKIVGDQLMAIGHVIQSMGLKPGARVLEMGFGWGNTTLQMALSGYHVTGIDITPDYVELVRRRAETLSLDVNVQVGNFFDVEGMQDNFDAVLFFESFHHCSDHRRLLKAIPRVLKPGGKLVLAGETINNALPYPWGINPDGQAVYCIRRFGWLELSFREEYILGLLDELGWSVTKYPFNQAAGIIYVAERR